MSVVGGASSADGRCARNREEIEARHELDYDVGGLRRLRTRLMCAGMRKLNLKRCDLKVLTQHESVLAFTNTPVSLPRSAPELSRTSSRRQSSPRHSRILPRPPWRCRRSTGRDSCSGSLHSHQPRSPPQAAPGRPRRQCTK